MSIKHAKKPDKTIVAAIYEAAACLEAIGNAGMYTGLFPDDCRWVLATRYNNERKGILFYSRGWGWRLRKSPDWRKVLQERFPDYATPENTEQTEQAEPAAGTVNSLSDPAAQ